MLTKSTVFLLIALVLPNVVRSQESPETDSLDVVTYNIRLFNPRDGKDHWPNRAEAVIEFVSQFDLIGLQEVTSQQRRELTQALSDDFGIYGIGRDDGDDRGESATVLYRKSRLQLVDASTFWLCETPDDVGKMGWDAACPRTVSWLKLKDKTTGKEFLFANTHFDHRGAKARANSARLIIDRMKKSAADTPAILLGDFNCRIESPPYQTLLSGGLSDARTRAEKQLEGPSSTWNGFRQIAPDQIIDHVFANGHVDVMESQIHNPKTDDDRFASDHMPVRIRVRLR